MTREMRADPDLCSLVFGKTPGHLLHESSGSGTEPRSPYVQLLPREPEAMWLLALLLLTDAGRPAHTAADGPPVSLEHQDRPRVIETPSPRAP